MAYRAKNIISLNRRKSIQNTDYGLCQGHLRPATITCVDFILKDTKTQISHIIMLLKGESHAKNTSCLSFTTTSVYRFAIKVSRIQMFS